MEAPPRYSNSGAQTSFVPAPLRPFTDMLLAGARVDDNRLRSKLSGIADLLGTIAYSQDMRRRFPDSGLILSGGETLDLVNFVEALVASGSMAALTSLREAGNCDWPLPNFVLTAVASGGVWGSPRAPKSARDRVLRRVCLRLLARMSFLSAERALAVDDIHPFMTMLQTRHRSGWGTDPVNFIYERYLRQPANHDAITHLMYLMVFMNRRYPWPQRHRHRADMEITKWLQDDNTNWCARSGMFGLQRARATLTLAVILPGFLQALLEDHTFWLLLAACGCAEDYVFDERNMYTALSLLVTNRGRESLCLWGGRRSILNGYFSCRGEEGRLIGMLRNNHVLSTWLCSEGGRSVLLDICRQRRRRVLQVGHSMH